MAFVRRCILPDINPSSKKVFLYWLIACCSLPSCGQSDKQQKPAAHEYVNALIHETSPYLLQHAHNPVHWYPWGEAALNKAKQENKMLLISVGYAACHWCHVMEHESYEDTVVANLMNRNFVCIKVDREERPDVDQIYMNAAYIINGSGGWPLNALAMPDGKPFFAGTYFPKKDWIRLLNYFVSLYQTNRAKLNNQANHIASGISDAENVPLNNEPLSFQKLPQRVYTLLEATLDRINGGTKGQPKFPMPCLWNFIMQYGYLQSNHVALNNVYTTLDRMAKGGIYDHLGGGFARYSTDDHWHAPHFEKMLYDNAQLIGLYSNAYKLTHNKLYKRIVYQSIAFIEREMTSPDGAFYSSIDADSEGKEGKFYTWSMDELQKILGSNTPIFADYYGVTVGGNWEPNQNILDINLADSTLLQAYHLSESQMREKVNSLNQLVFSQREKRIHPRTDDKIITAWNAMMTQGLLSAYEAFGETSFLMLAKKNIDYLLLHATSKDNVLYRNTKNGKAYIPAFLDDYSFLISMLTDYYQISFEQKYLEKARQMTEYVEQHFYDKSSDMFFYTDASFSHLIARKMEVADNVIPSSNSVMAKNLFLLGIYFENSKYADQAKQMISNVASSIEQNPGFYGNWAVAMNLQVHVPYEIAIVGDHWQEKLSDFHLHYLPDALYLGGATDKGLELLNNKWVKDRTMIYVCENRSCKKPVESVLLALNQMNP
ncbi:MAG: thioredoxin domain-containing protein [Ferruginibacter sp.]